MRTLLFGLLAVGALCIATAPAAEAAGPSGALPMKAAARIAVPAVSPDVWIGFGYGGGYYPYPRPYPYYRSYGYAPYYRPYYSGAYYRPYYRPYYSRPSIHLGYRGYYGSSYRGYRGYRGYGGTVRVPGRRR